MREQESFFRSLKAERTARKVHCRREQARSDASDHIERSYDPMRRHSTHCHVSPIEFEKAKEASDSIIEIVVATGRRIWQATNAVERNRRPVRISRPNQYEYDLSTPGAPMRVMKSLFPVLMTLCTMAVGQPMGEIEVAGYGGWKTPAGSGQHRPRPVTIAANTSANLSAKDLSGNADSQFVLATDYLKAGDIDRGILLLNKSSENGSHRASNTLGLYFANGYYVKRDEQKALSFYELAASQGSAHAAYNLGSHYAVDGKSRDDSKALSWFSKAAKAGDNDAAVSYSRIKNGFAMYNLRAGTEAPQPWETESMGPNAVESLRQFDDKAITEIINGRNLLGHAGIDPASLTTSLKKAGLNPDSLQYAPARKEIFQTSEGLGSAYVIAICSRGKSWCVSPYETGEALLSIGMSRDRIYVNLWIASPKDQANGSKPIWCKLKDSVFWCNKHEYNYSVLARINAPYRIGGKPELAMALRTGYADSTGTNDWLDRMAEKFVKRQIEEVWSRTCDEQDKLLFSGRLTSCTWRD